MSVIGSRGQADLRAVLAEGARDAYQESPVDGRHPFELHLLPGLEARLAAAPSSQDRRRRRFGRLLLLLAVLALDYQLQDRVQIREAKLFDGTRDGDP